MSKHTPAPWMVKKWETETYKGCEIMNLEGVRVSYLSNLNWEANAKLIAAAPELLEACNIALRYFNGIDTESQSEAAFHALNNAIKKATL